MPITYQAIIDAQNFIHKGLTFQEMIEHPDMAEHCILDDDLADFEQEVMAD